MSRISPPMRILLGGAVVFLALWFTILRPKSADTAATTAVAPTATPAGNVNTGAPAQSEAGKLVQKAKQAAATAATAAKTAAGDTTATATATVAPGTKSSSATAKAATPVAQVLPTVPAATLAKLPKDVAKAISAHKVLVLAVLADGGKHWRPMADDDRYVRNTLAKVNRYDHTVLVKQVPLATLMTYGPLVNDLDVSQTPSIVVVDRTLKADVLTGYVDRITINQAIADARSAGTDRLITDTYLRQVNAVCGKFNIADSRWSQPTVRGRKANIAAMKRDIANVTGFQAALAGTDAPAKWRGLRKQTLTVIGYDRSVLTKALKKAQKSHDEVTSWNASLYLTPAQAKTGHKLDDRFNTVGLTSCANNRRQ